MQSKSNPNKIDNLIHEGYYFRSKVYLEQSIVLIRNNWALFATFSMIYLAFVVFVMRMGQVGSIANVFLSGPISAGYYIIIHRISTNQAYSFENFFDGFRIFLPVFMASLASNFISNMGLMLFIIPGLYFYISYLIVMPLVIFRGLNFWPAMEASRMIVSKQFWEISKFGFILVTLNLVGALFLGFGLLFTIPFTYAAIYNAYVDIVGVDEVVEQQNKDLSHFR